MQYFRPLSNGGEVSHSRWSWISLVVGFFAMLAGGTLYTFSLFGPSFHHAFALSGLQINLMASFGQIGAAAASFPAGLLFDWTGPAIPLALSGLLMFLGYFLLYLLLEKTVPFSFFGTIMSYFVVGIGCKRLTIDLVVFHFCTFFFFFFQLS